MKVVENYEKVIKAGPPRQSGSDAVTFKKQQEYYKNLMKRGIAKPDVYNIKPMSSFS